ncbi:MAG: hypothetical protein D6719_13075 [Candidatus Dadabacteria bacterium]|nr:MAG: hypothetical protein D6719_13075 [Candidatus Dadabacteria bacterium]
MSHDIVLNIDIDEALESEPLNTDSSLRKLMWFCVAVAVVVFFIALATDDPRHVWGAFYTNLVFFMGLAAGGVMTTAIFQIVRAKWSPPIRRFAEANVAFLPWAFLLFLASYAGKEYLFSWAQKPMPGREWWMQPCFVYARFFVLFGLLYYLFYRFVWTSLRGDIGMLREQSKNASRWKGLIYKSLAKDWKGADVEVPALQRRMSYCAPVLVVIYAVVYTLFSTEMLAGMNEVWFSNMIGGFEFLGNIYMGWAVTGLFAIYYASRNSAYEKILDKQQLWDLGKLCFGFCMLWGYTFFSQFLPQWYGNMPEETQWLILRTREYPWREFGWFTFAMCFVIPFILLVSEDLKKNPVTFSLVAFIICIGLWCEKYIIIMPELSGASIPFSYVEVALFFGFLGAYILSISAFLRTFPYVPLSHPLTRGSTDW